MNLKKCKVFSETNNLESNKKSFKKFLPIILVTTVALLIIAIFAGIKIHNSVERKNHPALPEEIIMGTNLQNMEFDNTKEVFHIDQHNNYMKYLKRKLDVDHYTETFSEFFNEKILIKEAYAFFDRDKKLYKIEFLIQCDSEAQATKKMEMFSIYYSKTTSKKIPFKSDKLEFEINSDKFNITNQNSYISFTVFSKTLNPGITEVDDLTLKSHFLKACNDYYSGIPFKKTLKEVLEKNEYIQNLKINFYSSPDYFLTGGGGCINEFHKSNYVKYISNSYVAVVKGDIYGQKDQNIVKIILIFDDNGNFIDTLLSTGQLSNYNFFKRN